MFTEKDDLARPHVCALMSLVPAGGNGVREKIQDSYVGARWRGGGTKNAVSLVTAPVPFWRL